MSVSSLSASTRVNPSHSLWWRDLLSIGNDGNDGWFRSNVSNVLGDGFILSFWHDKWLGTVALKVAYPELFSVALLPDGSIADMGYWHNDRWFWKLLWPEALLPEQQHAVAELQLLLCDIHPLNRPDRRRWIPNQSGEFMVNSAYASLLSRGEGQIIDELQVAAIRRLWRNNIPSKGA
ncbi:ribonuclease H protein [Trifolium medium]|uniref:Ribonuclease H protein n=1 Tax=Trifolium medium TaxID=97028 RepID=A0A392M806_9FABA|nr:ribonuclease H protein [Trifolium medium]